MWPTCCTPTVNHRPASPDKAQKQALAPLAWALTALALVYRLYRLHTRQKYEQQEPVWPPAALRTAPGAQPLHALRARRSTIASRRGEQRGASRQSGADPSLSTTRTCLSRSEVTCKRAAGAGEREGWAQLCFIPFCPFSAEFSSAVWRRTDHAAHGCVHTGGQHHLTAAICVAAPPERRKPGAATALRHCGVAAAAREARRVKSPSTAPARCHRAQGWR